MEEYLTPEHKLPACDREWQVISLGDAVASIVGGGTPSRLVREYWNGDFPWVTVKDLMSFDPHRSQEYITKSGLANSSSRLIKRGTVIVSTRMSIGKAVRYEVDVCINQDLKALYVHDWLDRTFLCYWFENNRKMIEQEAGGSTVMGISIGDLRKLPFRAVPFPEQQAIAAALSDVDELIDSLDALIAKKRDIKQAAMQELLTGKRRLPGFNGEWGHRRLKDIAPLQRGFDLPSSHLANGTHPVVYSNGVLHYHKDFMVKGPGVVTGRSGTIGQVHYIEDNYWPHNTTLWVTSFKDNCPKYVFYLYSFIGLERFSTGSGVPTLNRNDVHAYVVTFPSNTKEQQAIAAVLSDMDAEIEALDRKRDKTIALKQGMMQELLTGRIRLV